MSGVWGFIIKVCYSNGIGDLNDPKKDQRKEVIKLKYGLKNYGNIIPISVPHSAQWKFIKNLWDKVQVQTKWRISYRKRIKL